MHIRITLKLVIVHRTPGVDVVLLPYQGLLWYTLFTLSTLDAKKEIQFIDLKVDSLFLRGSSHSSWPMLSLCSPCCLASFLACCLV